MDRKCFVEECDGLRSRVLTVVVNNNILHHTRTQNQDHLYTKSHGAMYLMMTKH